MGAIEEIVKQMIAIFGPGKWCSGIAASFFIIPIRPDFPWELQLFFYIIIGAIFAAISLWANELILKGLKLESDKSSSKMGLLNRMGFFEAFVFIIITIYLRGGIIW